MKSIRVSVLGVLFALGMIGTAWGQPIVQLTEEQFSPDRVSLNFNSFREGAMASDLFDGYGFSITGIGGGTPTLLGDLVAGQPFRFVSNEAEPAAGLNTQLILDFRRPVRQVGFLLRHGGTATVDVRFMFRNPEGQNIGVLTGQVDPGIGPFAGFEAPQGETFSQILISYGDSPSPEQIFNLLFTYEARPTFRSYVAQIGDGALGGGGGLRTNILVANLTDTTATGQLLLFGDDGQPLELSLNGQTGSEFDLTVPPNSVRAFRTGADSTPPVAGYASVVTNVPTSGVGIFQIVNADGSIVSEAGVESTAARHRVLSTVTRDGAIGLDSGVAVANVGERAATAVAQLLDTNGDTVANNTNFFALGPGEHRAAFLGDIFPGLPADFEGTLLIISDTPLAVVALRTVQGLVQSSLPSASLEP